MQKNARERSTTSEGISDAGQSARNGAIVWKFRLFVLAIFIIYFGVAAFLIWKDQTPLMLFVLLAVWLVWMPAMAGFSGWRKLATLYRAKVVYTGERMTPDAALMRAGPAYRWLQIGADSRGIHLSQPALFSIGYPYLFVPWHHLKLQAGSFPTNWMMWGGDHQLLIHFLRMPDVTLRIRGAYVVDTLLQKAAAADPDAIESDAQTQGVIAQARMFPARKVSVWGGLLIVAVVVAIEYVNSPDRRLHNLVVSRQAEAQSIVDRLRSPAGAVRSGAPYVSAAEEIGPHVFFNQTYASPAPFAETAAWYEADLKQSGWILTSAPDASEITFCRGEWILGVDENEPDQYRIALSWYYPPKPCPPAQPNLRPNP